MSSSGLTKRQSGFSDISCVVVAYKPNCLVLNEKIRCLSDSFNVVAVSNADSEATAKDFNDLIDGELCSKISLGDNRGIGAAQNIGAAHALTEGAKYILLLDDDSDISNTDIFALLDRYTKLSGMGVKVGAVAPAVVDAESLDNIVHKLDNNLPYTVIRDLMSSGTLIPAEIFKITGPMREDLFIDCVDYEWGWRCQRMGFKLVVDNQIKIRHKLGQSTVTCAPGLAIRVPSPIRHYYQFRNIIALTLYSRAPVAWRLKNFLTLFLKLPAYLVLLDARTNRAKYMFTGIYDGLRNKMGKYAW